MILLAGSITHGQAVAIALLCVFLIIFIIVDVYLVLFLHRRNKKLAQNNKQDDTEPNEGANITKN